MLEHIVTVKCVGTPGEPQEFKVEAGTTAEALHEAYLECRKASEDHLADDDDGDEWDDFDDEDWEDDEDE